jgi:phosphoribosylaminoimidazole-succinocarboxamide synthase
MIKLEVIVRDVVDENSSYLTRNPDTVPGLRFPEPRVEFFLKTDTDEIGGIKLPDIDPFITRWDDTGVWVHHPKKPVTEEGEIFVPADVLGWDKDGAWPFRQIATLSLRGFSVARKAWGRLGFDLRDWKGEFGIDLSGRLLWADVLDNDSWRMFGPDGKEYSKQNIRLGKSIEEAANDYRYIAEQSNMMLRLARAA